MKGIGKLLLDKGIIEEDDIQIYLYGIKGGITIIVNILTTLLIGWITGKMLEVIIFSLFLASLRSYSGGYHCSTKVGCFWLSSVVTAISAFSEELVTLLPIAVSYVVWIIAILVIYALSPLESKNKKLDSDEIRYYKKNSHCILTIQICIICSIYILEARNMAYAAGLSTVVIAFSLVCGKWIHIKKDRV